MDDVRRVAAAHAGAADIHVRPPFRLVWSAPVGALIEFPAVVDDGVAYVSNFRGSIRASR